VPDGTNVTTASCAAEIPTQPIPRERLRRQALLPVFNAGEGLNQGHKALAKRVPGRHTAPLLRLLADENDVIIFEFQPTRWHRGSIVTMRIEVRK
jgi:hypothetical protein